MRRYVVRLASLVLLLPVLAVAPPSTAEPTAAPPAAEKQAATGLRTAVVMRGLDIPWDVAVLPSRRWLVTERDGRLLLRFRDGRRRVLAAPPRVWTFGETGLMSVVTDPAYRSNRRFYTCTGWKQDGRVDIRVHAWRMRPSGTSARIVQTLVKGIGAPVSSGRHGGCRLRFDAHRRLYIGTGDATIGTAPQRLRSAGGKVLRVNPDTGRPSRHNPYRRADSLTMRRVFTFGHRNVQGLALRPGGGMWSVEHGTSRDDEVNQLGPGRNFGWDPGPGYDESTPMTDFSVRGRQWAARWRSGSPTIATSGAVWVRGRQWGDLRGTLAVAALKAERLLFLRFGPRGRLLGVRTPAAMRGTYGRLRSVVQAPSGDLLVTTSNGEQDRIIRVRPR